MTMPTIAMMTTSPTATSFGDNYNFQPLNYLFTPSTRVNLFSNGHYDITKAGFTSGA